MRAIVVLTLALAVGGAAAAAAPGTTLTITVWPDGRGKASKTWTLRCAPVGGNLPRAARACSSLAALRNPFAPVPPDALCTEIYGGPAVALVTGRHKGRRVNARFGRTDGCQISRWRRHEFLFGGLKLGNP